MSRNRAIALLSIGADTVPSATANPGRPLGVAAVGTYLTMDNRKRYLLWILMPEGKTIVEASDKEDHIRTLFSDVGKTDTPWGDTSGAIYAAWWDTTDKPIKPRAEYAGEIVIKADVPPPAGDLGVPTSSKPPPEKKSMMGWILGGMAALVGIGLATRKR